MSENYDEEENSGPPESGGGGEEEGGWLVSYADMMTLIACFFILMSSFAVYDKATFIRKAQLVSKYFQGSTDSQEEDMMTDLLTELNTNSLVTDISEVRYNQDGLEISFNVSALFNTGSAVLNQEAVRRINTIVAMIRAKKENYRILVEGHTDSRPMNSNAKFDSNWELSSARASAVVKLFEKEKFRRSDLVAIGYSDSRPLVYDKDEDGKYIPEAMNKNRRVILKVLRPVSEDVPFGFNVYFQDGAPKNVLQRN